MDEWRRSQAAAQLSPSGGGRPVQERVDEVNRLAQAVAEQVSAFVGRHEGSAQAIEQTVLQGVAASLETIEHLNRLLDPAYRSQHVAESLNDALVHLEQQLAFFQGCTLRRSSARAAHDEGSLAHAEEAETLAAEARAAGAIEHLVEAYKAVEAIEARVIASRAKTKTGSAPEPRVLDLPRARILVARRAIGSAIVSLDSAGQ